MACCASYRTNTVPKHQHAPTTELPNSKHLFASITVLVHYASYISTPVSGLRGSCLVIASRLFPTLLLSALILGTTTACGSWWLPRAHKIEIQQGNLLPIEAVEKVMEGMSRNEVESLLGKPVASNYFDRQQWDYIYSINSSGDAPQSKTLTLKFENDRVVSIEKNGLS